MGTPQYSRSDPEVTTALFGAVPIRVTQERGELGQAWIDLILPVIVRAALEALAAVHAQAGTCLLYTSPSPRDVEESRMPSSA